MKAGERYKILNNTLSGRVIVEGIATLVEPVDAELNRWIVAFDGDDGMTVERFVNPENLITGK